MTEPDEISRRTWPCSRASARRGRRWRRSRPRARPCASRAGRRGAPTLGICLGLQLALEQLGRGRRRRGARHPSWPGHPSAQRARAEHRLGCGGARAARRSTSPTRSRPRPRRPRPPPRVSSPRHGSAASSACSSIPRRARRPERDTWSDASPSFDSLSRRRRRPRRQGRQFEGFRDMGDPVELGSAYSDAGADELVFLDVKATVGGANALVELVRSSRRALAIPFTVGGGIRTVGRRGGPARRGADKVSVNSAAVARPELLGARRAARLPGRRDRDRRGGRRGLYPCRTSPAGRLAVEWAREARGARRRRDTAHLDRRRRHAGRLRPRAHSRRRRRGLDPRHRLGRRGRGRHVADALGVAQAALLASILHENPDRLAAFAPSCERSGSPSVMPTSPELRAAIVQDAPKGACSCSPGWTRRRSG